MVARLTTAAGVPLTVDEGNSVSLTVTLHDAQDNVVDAAGLLPFD